MIKKAVERFLKSRHEERKLEGDLLAVYYDPRCSLERRRAALQECHEFRKQWEQLEDQEHAEIVTLSLVPHHHPSKSERLLSVKNTWT